MQETKPILAKISNIETLIWTLDLDGMFDNLLLKKYILEHKERYPEPNTPTIQTWNTTLHLHHINSNFDFFVEKINEKVNKVVNDHFYYTYYIDNLWAMIYEKGSYTKMHDHRGAHYAFVYYVEADENTSPLIFEKNIVIKPKTSRLVLFSGFLKHEVPELVEDSARIAIAGNLLKIPMGFVKTPIKSDSLEKLLESEKRDKKTYN